MMKQLTLVACGVLVLSTIAVTNVAPEPQTQCWSARWERKRLEVRSVVAGSDPVVPEGVVIVRPEGDEEWAVNAG